MLARDCRRAAPRRGDIVGARPATRPPGRRRARWRASSVSAVLFLAVAAAQSAMVGATWQFTGPHAVLARAGRPAAGRLPRAGRGTAVSRRRVLRSLRAIAGDRWAIVLTAVAFGAYHVLGTRILGDGPGVPVPDADARRAALRLGGCSQRRPCAPDWAAPRRQLGAGERRGVRAACGPRRRRERPPGCGGFPISASDVQVLTAPDLLPRLPLLLAFAIAAALTGLWLRRSPDAQLLAAPKQ